MVKPNTETKYYLVVEYANKTDEDQSDQMGKSFSIDIGIGEKAISMSEKIADLAKADTTNFATDDTDNNVRYIGADPSNYVYFNCSDYSNPTADTCELWRIIGIFNNVTKADGFKENLVKIIRVDSLGDYSWDYKKTGIGTSTSNYGSNDWTDSQLMMMLNPTDYLKSGYTNSSDIISSGSQQLYSKMGSYYNGTKGCKSASIASGASFSCTEVDFTSTCLKNDTTRNAIEEVGWNLGGYSGENNFYPSDFYTYERGATKDRAACLAKELYNWDSSDFSDCKGNDYLYSSSNVQWTMAPGSAGARGVFYVNPTGNVDDGNAYGTGAVRPALFLKSSILLDTGTGAQSDPYTLKIK